MAIARIKILTVPYDQEFQIDPATETIIQVTDNKDGNICVFIITYVRKQ